MSARFLLFSLIGFLVGCPGSDDKPVDDTSDTGTPDTSDTHDTDTDTDTDDTGPVDSDEDGSPDEEDCAPTDATIYPGATEVCDGVDNNCDDQIDEGLSQTTYYQDNDADGYGDDASTTSTCDGPPDGFASQGGDCDDNAATTNPGTAELCEDGTDNDCDAEVDEDCEAPVTWYRDADADGFGDPADTVSAETRPDGYVDNGDDCDDAEATVYAGADELCDSLDNDCDAEVDEDVAYTTYYRDLDADGFGDPEDMTEGCATLEGYVEDSTDCDDADASVYPDADELCDEVDNDCDAEVDEDAVDASTWYMDADEDGFGLDDDTALSCAQPEGYAEYGGDCDDGDMAYNPGATEDDCADPNDYNCDGSTGYSDDDDDGWAACEDCDDTDDQIYPDALEYCDEVDNDCDSEIDESDAIDLETWYLDGDDDSYGDASSTDMACAAPDGYVDDDTDCDDADADINPGAIEVCDDADTDEDCDGDADDADDSATGQSDWYVDADLDGYGVADETMGACDLSEGLSDNADDCDDDDEYTYPGAAEVCVDLVVNDCDGTVELAEAECVLTGENSLTIADGRRFGESSSHMIGTTVFGPGDVDGDGYADVITGGPDIASKGRVYLFSGPATGDKSASTYMASISGESTGDQFGGALSGGDVNGDGFADLLVGADDDDDGGRAAGAAYVLLGPVSGEISTVTSVSDAKFAGAAADDSAGTHLSATGDVDGDGNDDLLVGAPGHDTAGRGAGVAYLVFGPGASLSLGSADAVLQGSATGAGAGGHVHLADLDGDGMADTIVSEYKADSGGTNTGSVYVFYGEPASGSVSDADWILTGATSEDAAGTTVATGDVDADGAGDLLVSAPGADGDATNGGGAWLLSGGGSGSETLSSSATAIISGHKSGGSVGETSAIVDLDGDGADDVALGSADLKFSTIAYGGAFLLYGPVSGAVSTEEADLTLKGENSGDQAFIGMANAWDTDGDGWEDLVIGAPGRDRGTNTDGGAVYLLLGSNY